MCLCSELSVDGKADDGQAAADSLTEQQLASRGDEPITSGHHGAGDTAAEDDAVADEDGKICLTSD